MTDIDKAIEEFVKTVYSKIINGKVQRHYAPTAFKKAIEKDKTEAIEKAFKAGVPHFLLDSIKEELWQQYKQELLKQINNG